MGFSENLAVDFDNLSEEQKMLFLRALARLASVDGSFDEEELSFIKYIANQHGVSDKELSDAIESDSDETVLKDLKTVKSRRLALEIIKEMCVLAHIDDNLADEEVMFIGKCGLAMGVEPEKTEQISNWVIDRIIWLEQAKIIFEE